MKCCLELLRNDLTFFRDVWNWSEFVELFWNKGCDKQKLYCNQIVALLTNMTGSQLNELNKKISIDLQTDEAINLKYHQNALQEVAPGKEKIQWNFSSDVVTSFEGVFLPIFDTENYKFYSETNGNFEAIVRVDSTKLNLRSLALGVSSGKAICLTGPVGSGKTTLVEYLARKTGRIAPKLQELKKNKSKIEDISAKAKKNKRNSEKFELKRKFNSLDDLEDIEKLEKSAPKNGFMRIQLGDQTDNKMLLGQYRCTDVPGEFVWQPGVLTQAVLNGYWLLLEDLDTATQDVCTVLTNLLENNYLSVPGFRDCIKIEPGFQLFVTLR